MALLDGRCALITGGAAGIGHAICKLFRDEGASVVSIDRKVCAQPLDEVTYITGDVSLAEQVDSAVAEATERLGQIDILVNNAGSGALATLHNYSLDQFDQLIKNNFYSVFYTSKTVIPMMLGNGGGCIINIASQTAERPTAGEAPYSAAKAAVVAMSKSTALEYGPTIRCNAISPGVIDTPLTAFILQPDIIQPMIQQCPLQRAGTAGEVASVALFLASPMASYINGQNIVVDGGLALPQAGINDVTGGLTRLLEGQSASE